MAPLTRGRRVRAEIAGESIEPLSPALASNTLTPTRSARNHVRFNQEGEDTPITARRAGSFTVEIVNGVNGREDEDGAVVDGIVDEGEGEGEGEDSDDDAPEAVSMGVGKQEAEKREEEAKRIVEAQKEATRKKRKERDIKLKEQKADAEERKRERERKRRKLDNAQVEQEAAIESQFSREAAAGKEKDSIELTSAPEADPVEPISTSKKSKPPLLLPESLLARVSARPSPPVSSDEVSDRDIGHSSALAPTGKSTSVARTEKNRRRREQKKRNKVLKKGVVNVKVLKDDSVSRKSMAPPASKQVEHIKESWLFTHRKGGVERRSIVGGFIKRK